MISICGQIRSQKCGRGQYFWGCPAPPPPSRTAHWQNTSTGVLNECDSVTSDIIDADYCSKITWGAPSNARACRFDPVVDRCPVRPRQHLYSVSRTFIHGEAHRRALFPLARHVFVYGFDVRTPAGNNFAPICCRAPASNRIPARWRCAVKCALCCAVQCAPTALLCVVRRCSYLNVVPGSSIAAPGHRTVCSTVFLTLWPTSLN